jgi:hypothetical protein
MSTRTELETLMAQVEGLWDNLDTLFQIISENQQWDQSHGQDWTFADVPYHLAYCNRDLVSRPMKLGRDLPVEERLSFATVDDLNEWNEREFANRPAGQTAEESLAEWHDSQDEMRQIVSDWTDADLDRPWWMPFLGGMWLEARNALGWTLAHDWSEFMQLRIHMGRSKPVPNPATTNHYLGMVIVGQYPLMLDVEAAQGREFRAIMAFTDPGVSNFSIEVVDGQASAKPGEVENPDLVITQSVESFEKTRSGLRPLTQAIQEGEVQVNDMESLATLGELFPM